MKSVIRGIIGENLKRLRIAKGLSQEQLAEKVRVEHPTYNRWENGINIPSDENSILLAEVLGVELEDLILPPAINARVDELTAFPSDANLWAPSLRLGAAVLDKLSRISPVRRISILALLFENPDLLNLLDPPIRQDLRTLSKVIG